MKHFNLKTLLALACIALPLAGTAETGTQDTLGNSGSNPGNESVTIPSPTPGSGIKPTPGMTPDTNTTTPGVQTPGPDMPGSTMENGSQGTTTQPSQQ